MDMDIDGWLNQRFHLSREHLVHILSVKWRNIVNELMLKASSITNS